MMVYVILYNGKRFSGWQITVQLLCYFHLLELTNQSTSSCPVYNHLQGDWCDVPKSHQYIRAHIYTKPWLVFPKYPPLFLCSSDRVLLHPGLPELVLKLQQLWKCKELTRGNKIRIDLHWALVGYFLLWKRGQSAKIVLRFITKEDALGPFLIIGKINGFWVKSVSGPLKVRCQSVCSLLVSAVQQHLFNT